ncbi:hypothetical protein IFE09_27160 [Streptomyces microflavus]|nr:hypothetical protein [Streptomyces microflavus]QQZ56881.1 hypothetical protein IFE09_27160 [Streptomyces microflavus]
MTTPLPDGLADYLVARDAQRAAAVTQFLSRLTDREHTLMREAAVMGYVQGRRHPQDEDQPKDTVTLRLVIDAALGLSDLYPAVASVEEQVTTTKLEHFVVVRQPDGTWEQASSSSTDPVYIQRQLARMQATHPDWECRINWLATTRTTGPIPRIVPAPTTPAPAAG